MCSSAKASFIAAGTLSVIGLLSLKKATHKKSALPLASTPLLFALQQASEGIVWISLTTGLPNNISQSAMYTFVFIAGAWWPFWTAIVLYIIEKEPVRKKLLFYFTILGTITGILYAISLITQPLQAIITNHHIYYPLLAYPFGTTTTAAEYAQTILSIMYLISTVVPCFLSSIEYTSLLGIVLFCAFITSQLFFVPTTASTWCFFAAMASILIYFIVQKSKSNKNHN